MFLVNTSTIRFGGFFMKAAHDHSTTAAATLHRLPTLPQTAISGAVVVATFMVWIGRQAAQQTTNMAQAQQSIVKLYTALDSLDTVLRLRRPF